MTTHDAAGTTVDFSMMYFAHDAFRRDLDRLAKAVGSGRKADPAVLRGWETFKRQLHIHHVVEDEALWPAVRERATGRLGDVAVLDAMAAEHARIDPMLDRVDAGLVAGPVHALGADIGALVEMLDTHLEHEERAALPLIERTVGSAGWAAFGRATRRRAGLRGAAEFFPWILDGAPAEARSAMLGMVPPPVRLLYRFVWRPAYQRRPRWSPA